MSELTKALQQAALSAALSTSLAHDVRVKYAANKARMEAAMTAGAEAELDWMVNTVIDKIKTASWTQLQIAFTTSMVHVDYYKIKGRLDFLSDNFEIDIMPIDKHVIKLQVTLRKLTP